MIIAMYDELRTELMILISDELRHQKINNKDACALLGTNESRISAIHTQRKQYPFQIMNLLQYLNILGLDVEITIKKSKSNLGELKVSPGIN